ncbi:DUF1345 domain-containing protein [Mucilaginibacter ginkgonis]|uniref:DUF1345 domain-containing protein n=1 Tax=Mucilaginibacter ginkgonis TaxID=2682091 RepID=A0A6I4I1D8_9SPHI|nr:DUF1345 domain-containing protein [Mucilaginibacter ginkgonis]QQL48666.1 DUF1345 domain-containing protein [Mucilaginibacter ginkgonis]
MPRKTEKPSRLLKLDVHYRILISLLCAAIVFFSIFKTELSVSSIILLTWIGFVVSAIVMDWLIIFMAHPQDFKQVNTLEDSSRTMIFIIVIGAAIVSLFSIIFLLKSEKGSTPQEVTGHVFLVIASVLSSWWLVHTIFAIRYAHIYYDTTNDDDSKKPFGGLDFPGGEKYPDFMDFVYFSFVLGMTFQVSDVEISNSQLRRLAWIHGLISFAFNTAIVALSINVISGLVAH